MARMKLSDMIYIINLAWIPIQKKYINGAQRQKTVRKFT